MKFTKFTMSCTINTYQRMVWYLDMDVIATCSCQTMVLLKIIKVVNAIDIVRYYYNNGFVLKIIKVGVY